MRFDVVTRNIINDDLTISDEIVGIYPVVVPANVSAQDKPVVVYNHVSTNPITSKNSWNDYDRGLMQISIFCKNYDKCLNVSELIRTKLDRFKGVITVENEHYYVDLIRFEGQDNIGFDEKNNVFMVAQDYLISMYKVDYVGREISIPKLIFNGVEFPAQSGFAPVDCTDFYYGLDLHTKTLVFLKYNFHDGCIFLGKLTTVNSEVTAFEVFEKPCLPSTFLSNSISKFRNGKGWDVLFVGDSLTSQVANSDLYPDYLLGNLTGSDYYLKDDAGNDLRDLHNVTIFATPGATSAVALAQIAPTTKGIDASITGQSFSLKTDKYNKSLSSRIFSNEFDVIIVALGMNGGRNSKLKLELLVRKLKQTKSDVILVTSNPKSNDYTTLEEQTKFIRKIASTYGCAVADTWSYILTAQMLSVDGTFPDLIFPVDDVVHPTSLGQSIYAKALRSVLPNIELDAKTRLTGNHIIAKSDNSFNIDNAKDGFELQIEPAYTTGNRLTESIYNDNAYAGVDINSVYYNKPYSDAIPLAAENGNANPITLTDGQIAKYSNEYSTGFCVVTDRRSTGTIEVTENGVVLYSFTGDGLSTPLCKAHDKNSDSQALSTFKQRNIQVKAIGGTAKIIGVLFFTEDLTPIPFKDIEFTGSWTVKEFVSNNIPNCAFTDTVDDSFIIKTNHQKIRLLFVKQRMAGFVKIDVNETEVINEDLNRQVSTAAIKQFNGIQSDSTFNTIQVTLSAVSPNESDPLSYPDYSRLIFVGAYAVNE